jgi:hypothetical protein
LLESVEASRPVKEPFDHIGVKDSRAAADFHPSILCNPLHKTGQVSRHTGLMKQWLANCISCQKGEIANKINSFFAFYEFFILCNPLQQPGREICHAGAL